MTGIGNLLDRIKNRGVNVNIQNVDEITLSLWAQDVRTDKSPAFKGYLYINGVKHKVVLWNNRTDNPRAPQFTGCLDAYQPLTTQA